MADNLNDLALIIKSHFPLVQVETSEEVRMMRLLERISNLENWPLFVWTVADGLKRFPRTDVVPQTYEFRDALRTMPHHPQAPAAWASSGRTNRRKPRNQKWCRSA